MTRTSSHLRSALERLRWLVKFGRRPRSRVQQIQRHLNRASLALPFPHHVPPLAPDVPPPLVIGANGGSGTRVLVRVLRRAGWFMGDRVKPHNEDSVPLGWFLTKWLKELHDFPNVDPVALRRAIRDFDRMVCIHRRGVPSTGASWGWKNPRNLWLMPFLVDRFPTLKFIHMIRDARDMMLSENNHFLRKHAPWLVGLDWWRDPEATKLEIWRQGNNRALKFAQKYLKDSYYMVRYEDLIYKPTETVSGVMKFLGKPDVDVEPLIEGIRDRGNIGRWRKVQRRDWQSVAAAIGPDLRQFGYQV